MSVLTSHSTSSNAFLFWPAIRAAATNAVRECVNGMESQDGWEYGGSGEEYRGSGLRSGAALGGFENFCLKRVGMQFIRL